MTCRSSRSRCGARDPALGAHELGQVARAIESEIKRVPGTRNVYTVGDPRAARPRRARPAAPRRRRPHRRATSRARCRPPTSCARPARSSVTIASSPVQAGQFLANRDDVGGLIVVGARRQAGLLDDVATVTRRARTRRLTTSGSARAPAGASAGHGAVTSRAGGHASRSPRSPAPTRSTSPPPSSSRVEQLRGITIPAGVEVTVTRNYGVTANDKAKKLIEKLLFATASVVLLVLLAVGTREAVVVGAAVIVTLAATLFASWAWGFTINRVSLFALIFSIGILVDDAIVIVENVHRHLQLEHGHRSPRSSRRAVDEVGGPTILATFTVIAALLPMAFVSGLMGPYMSPIPINASMGMLISLAVALDLHAVAVPQALRQRDARRRTAEARHGRQACSASSTRLMTPVPDRRPTARTQPPPAVSRAPRRPSLVAVLLAVVQLVVLKMLPFDNKSEFQVVVNMPEGTPVEDDRRSARRARQPSCARCRRSPTTRPMRAPRRRSISTAWCASTTCAPTANSGRPAGQPRRQERPQPQEPRDRARDAPGARRRGQAARRRFGAGGRGAAGAAGASAASSPRSTARRYAAQQTIGHGGARAVRHDHATSSIPTIP